MSAKGPRSVTRRLGLNVRFAQKRTRLVSSPVSIGAVGIHGQPWSEVTDGPVRLYQTAGPRGP
jgi:hypothetical protein